MPGEQLHSDIVSRSNPEAALHLQTAQREVDDPHCLEPTMAVDQCRKTDRMAIIAPPNRRALVVG
jgi:hypothetical protein